MRTHLAVLLLTFAFWGNPGPGRGQQAEGPNEKPPLPTWNYIPMTGRERCERLTRPSGSTKHFLDALDNCPIVLQLSKYVQQEIRGANHQVR